MSSETNLIRVIKLVTPFAYPKSLHHRTETPKNYSDYRSFKPYLKREFHNSCIYCRLPDVLKTESAFGVDHYKPQKLAPELSSYYPNLFYACNTCNSYKGSFWPNKHELKGGYYIPNPCDHVMFEHLRYQKDTVVSRSKAGECAIEILDLNDPRSIQYRQMYLTTIAICVAAQRDTKETIAMIRKKIKSVTNIAFAEKLQLVLVQETVKLKEVEEHLAKLINT
jgi:hypothetical protein